MNGERKHQVFNRHKEFNRNWKEENIHFHKWEPHIETFFGKFGFRFKIWGWKSDGCSRYRCYCPNPPLFVEFHSITGMVCAVNSADKLIKEDCFPRHWPLKTSWPWWILPRETKDMMYCSYCEFSVKKELREAKAPSIEGSVVVEYTHLSHFRAHIWMT